MKIGLYSDPHFLKDSRDLSRELSRERSLLILKGMYDTFRVQGVDQIICAGDFFDKSLLRAREIKYLSQICDCIKSTSIPTYILAGNHDLETSTESLISLLGLIGVANPITEVTVSQEVKFYPYGSFNLDSINPTDPPLIVTHEDYAGSTMNSLGRLSGSRLSLKPITEPVFVFNGHIHFKGVARFGEACLFNLGSLFPTAQGDVCFGDYPSYYIYDTVNKDLQEFKVLNSIIPLTVTARDLLEREVLKAYESPEVLFRLKIIYDTPEESDRLKGTLLDTRIVSMEIVKSLKSSTLESSREFVDHLQEISIPTISAKKIEDDTSLSEIKKKDIQKVNSEVFTHPPKNSK